MPAKISSDNGKPFVNAALKQVAEYLGIDMRQHCAYHPASGGAVERENGTLKKRWLNVVKRPVCHGQWHFPLLNES